MQENIWRPVGAARRIALHAAMVIAAALFSSATAAAPAWQPADGEQLAFEIFDGEQPAGQLLIRFSRPDAQTLLVQRRAEIAVSRLLMKASLVQASEERRANNRLMAFSSSTQFKSLVKDASATLTLSRDADGALTGQSDAGAVSLPAGAMPTSFWRGDELKDGTYFDTSSGKPLSFKVSPIAAGERPSPRANITACQGREVHISDGEKKSRALLWVDAVGRLCTMRFHTELGPLDYVPTVKKQ